jgi:hypothetical protein
MSDADVVVGQSVVDVVAGVITAAVVAPPPIELVEVSSGAAGPPGPPGSDGAQGPQGPQGPPGVDAAIGAGYLVTVADPTLTGEVVVGTTPGGELGGTWASPTVDASHSGSTHAATQAAAETTAANALTAHAGAADPHPGYLTPAEGAAAYAPIGAGYLTTAADAALTGEVVVGTTPGGELGGTWASPTVDAVHSGSAHLALGTTSSTAAAGDHTHAGGAPGVASRTASVAIANTETQVIGYTVPAGSAIAGTTYRLFCAGVFTSGATSGVVSVVRVRIGATTLTGAIPTSISPGAGINQAAAPFTFEALVTFRTVGAGGTIIGTITFLSLNVDQTLNAFGGGIGQAVATATVAVDTTAARILELTYISGNAASTATFHLATIEKVV